MICLAESLIENGFDQADQLRRYKDWVFNGYATPDGKKPYDIGGQTAYILASLEEKDIPKKLTNSDEKAGGNGALMRCAPIALYYYGNTDDVIKYSILSAIVTHDNAIAAWSCVILNLVLLECLAGTSKKSVLSNVQKVLPKACPGKLRGLLEIDYNNVDTLRWERWGYSLYTLRIALYSFLRTNNFYDAMDVSLKFGGDTDTNCAVTGALAGAWYGDYEIPERWMEQMMNREGIFAAALKLKSG